MLFMLHTEFKKLRKQIGMSQEALADELQMHPSSINRFENKSEIIPMRVQLALRYIHWSRTLNHILVRINGEVNETSIDEVTAFEFRKGIITPKARVQFWHETEKAQYAPLNLAGPPTHSRDTTPQEEFPDIDPTTWEKP